MNNKISKFFLCFFINLFLLCPVYADDSIEEFSPHEESSFPSETEDIFPENPLFDGDLNQQGGIINNDFPGSICTQPCAYSYFEVNRLDTRFGIGVNVPLSSPNNTLMNARAKKVGNDDARIYIESISAACQAKDFLRAELNARGLAQLWDVDYQSLLSSDCIQKKSGL